MSRGFQKLKKVAKQQKPGRKRPKAVEVKPGSYHILDIDRFREFFANFSSLMKPGDLLLLKGEVGAGKTEAIRAIVENLGGRWVSSPSFAVHQRYATRICYLDHVDLYRLEDDEDLESTGFWDLFDDKENIIAVEWADRMTEDAWPLNRRRLILEIKKGSDKGSDPDIREVLFLLV